MGISLETYFCAMHNNVSKFVCRFKFADKSKTRIRSTKKVPSQHYIDEGVIGRCDAWIVLHSRDSLWTLVFFFFIFFVSRLALLRLSHRAARKKSKKEEKKKHHNEKLWINIVYEREDERSSDHNARIAREREICNEREKSRETRFSFNFSWLLMFREQFRRHWCRSHSLERFLFVINPQCV